MKRDTNKAHKLFVSLNGWTGGSIGRAMFIAAMIHTAMIVNTRGKPSTWKLGRAVRKGELTQFFNSGSVLRHHGPKGTGYLADEGKMVALTAKGLNAMRESLDESVTSKYSCTPKQVQEWLHFFKTGEVRQAGKEGGASIGGFEPGVIE